jgi:hypothetical protein
VRRPGGLFAVWTPRPSALVHDIVKDVVARLGEDRQIDVQTHALALAA